MNFNQETSSPYIPIKFFWGAIKSITTSLAFSFLLLYLDSCSTQTQAKSVTTEPRIHKERAIVLIADPTKSAILRYAQEQITVEKINLLIDKTALYGGADIYIYGIDEQCTNNQPLFIQVPGITRFYTLKKMNVGDEEYDNYKSKTIAKFKMDSLNAVEIVEKIKASYQKSISEFLTKTYKDSLQWTDIYGVINNANAVLSSPKYKSYLYREIIAFGDLEHSLPDKSKYKPELDSLSSDIKVILVSGTTGQKPSVNKYERVTNFEMYLSSNF